MSTTFYNFSHIFQSWIFPPGLVIVLGFIGLLLWSKHPRVAKTLVISAFCLLWVLSTPLFASYLIRSLQGKYPLLTAENISTKQGSRAAIVVLSGSSCVSTTLEVNAVVSYNSLTRLAYAAYLYRHLHLPIIVSGGRSPQARTSAAPQMLQALRDNFQIPASVIWMENKSLTTGDESIFLLPVLQQHKIRTIYLVTDAWHMPRSMQIFKKNLGTRGYTIIAAPMGFFRPRSPKLAKNYMPTAKSLTITFLALHEYVGAIWYRWHYSSELSGEEAGESAED